MPVTTPESQGGELDKHTQHERFLMARSWKEHDLTFGERASLLEHIKDTEWRDETAIAYYDSLHAELESHPGEFITTATKYEHGIGFDVLMPVEGDGLIDRGYVGAVILASRDHIDISDRIPMWKHFPSGIEFFAPFSQEGMPAHPAYRTPNMNLTDARLVQGRGTNAPEAIDVIVGNDELATYIEGLVTDELLTATAARDFALALAVLCEGHKIKPVAFPFLLEEISGAEQYYLRLQELFMHQQKTNAELISKVGLARAAFELGRGELAQQHSNLPSEGYSTSLRAEDTRTWPYMTLGDYGSQVNSIQSVISSLENENKELHRNQIPVTSFYLSAIRHLIASTLEAS